MILYYTTQLLAQFLCYLIRVTSKELIYDQTSHCWAQFSKPVHLPISSLWCGFGVVIWLTRRSRMACPPLHFPSYLWITKIYLCFIHVIPIKCHPVLLELLSKKPKYLYNKANNIFLYVIILLIYYMIQECVICLIIQILVLWRHQYFSCISQIESFLSLTTFFL